MSIITVIIKNNLTSDTTYGGTDNTKKEVLIIFLLMSAVSVRGYIISKNCLSIVVVYRPTIVVAYHSQL